MANQEHLNKLNEGVEAWHRWRNEHPGVQPDLRDTDLQHANLLVADLHNADLRNANLNFSDLRNANLRNTNLSFADLRSANLSLADLRNANLHNTNLHNTNLYGTNLHNTNFHGANLHGANLSFAMAAWTTFGNVDLSATLGLDTVIHSGPSTIGIDTIYRSQGKIPETFLRDAGIPNTFLEYLASLVDTSIEYSSCVISYSSKDEAFARQLYADLQNNNVCCWLAPEDMKWKERIRTGIDEAIRLHDKLLLILSRHSLASVWVEHEVETALAKERKEQRTVLFPVRVDNAILDISFSWAAEIRHEHRIGDFTQWKEHNAYEKALARLLLDLKKECYSYSGPSGL